MTLSTHPFPVPPAYFYLYTSSTTTFEFTREFLKQYEALNIHVRTIDHNMITKDKILRHNPEQILGLFIPGGRSGQQFHEDLKLEGSKEVKSYVKKGGAYSGTCLGGFAAFENTEYQDRNVKKQYQSACDLFKGKAIGRLPLSQGDVKQPRGWQNVLMTSVSFKTLSGQPSQALVTYWDGPKFIPAPDEQIDILATYDAVTEEDGSPAIAMVAKSYGLGRAVVSGVHGEISGEMLRTSGAARFIDHDDGTLRHTLADQLDVQDTERASLMQTMMHEIFKTKRAERHLQAMMRYYRDADCIVMPICGTNPQCYMDNEFKLA